MKILFIGDVVGKIGRKALEEKLFEIKNTKQIDFIIVNGENISHGKGIIKKHYNFLRNLQVDVITLGNHYHNKSEIDSFITTADHLIRPINLINYNLGEGTRVFKCKNINIRITNLLCKSFMNIDCNDPKDVLESLLNGLNYPNNNEIHIVDLHGEASGEKQSISNYFDGKVSAFLGTHTHVQTNDLRVLPKGTLYITDVGMCGASDSILGFNKESVINKTLLNLNSPFKLDDDGNYIICGVIMDFLENSNKLIGYELLKYESKK